MTPRLLDKDSLMAREQEIIDATITLIAQTGVENITMDKVISAVPYSKGTVYKHFLGKEDLFLGVSNHANRIMSDLFIRAAKYQGCSRERMLLIQVSYLIYAILHPALFQSVQCAKSPNVYGKSSEERLTEQINLEAKVMMTVCGIVEDGAANNDLVIPEHMTPLQVCFSSWAASYGTIALLAPEMYRCTPSSDMVVERELLNQNNIIFDGLNWSPLSKDKDYKISISTAIQTVFPGELALIKSLGRELIFT